ncbi:MAG: class I SAM-dependent methyltransferase [Chitinophagales bacterium]|nr:class I SAM-dependent methyltransferase [Chitinophagales bacterium]
MKNSQILIQQPQTFKNYQLLDSGIGMKIERFENIITIRPEPQAVWELSESLAYWEKQAHTKFVPASSNSGIWKKLKNTPDNWHLNYNGAVNFTFKLALTGFKHVGVFPEQAVNWEYIANAVNALKAKNIQPKFLNLFAYTGGASLAAKAAGADVTHVDSIKQVVSWANENMQQSNLTNIRWVVEDALKFTKREAKRGNKYHGIILDPPAFGHGPSGEKWKLEDNILEMMNTVQQLLDNENHFLILNAYSLGFSSLILENLIQDKFKKSNFEIGELFIQDSFGKKLPLGAFARFRSC